MANIDNYLGQLPADAQAEWARVVAAAPQEHRHDLESSLAALQAWEQARRAGHAEADVMSDMAYCFRTNGGVGLVITRLRSMRTKPVSKPDNGLTVAETNGPLPECLSCGLPYKRRHLSSLPDDAPCSGCGEPLVTVHIDPSRRQQRGLDAGKRLSAEHTEERMSLLRMIYRQRIDPDRAEDMMRQLIARQAT